MKKILEIKNLKKSYNKKRVLDIDSLEIEEKSIYGLIGKNGAGKSTLMKLILGLVKKDGGEIKVFGCELNSKNQKDFNKNLGALIENPSFYDHLTGYENLEIICKLKGIKKDEIKKTLDLVGLKNVEKKESSSIFFGYEAKAWNCHSFNWKSQTFNLRWANKRSRPPRNWRDEKFI